MLYQNSGLAGLARKPRNDHGKHRRISDGLRKAIEGLTLQRPALPVSVIHRRIAELAQVLHEPAPSYSHLSFLVRQIPDDLKTLAQQGSKAYADAFELVHRREAEHPNAIWQADHCLLDVLVKRPDSREAKPWLSIIIDDFSRAVAGFFLAFEDPCALRTALTLRQAIWRKDDPRWHVCGIPDSFYTDHGSDFTSRHLEQVSADLRIRLIFSLPGQPRGRGRIERFFATVATMFLPILPGYSPPGQKAGKASLTLPELEARFQDFLLGVYHAREHGETRARPQERWNQGGFLPRLPESLEQLDLLLLTVPTARKVHSDGIRFQGMRYVDPLLAAYVGESVLLRYDPRDMAELRVFHEGRFLCRAICPELAGQTIALAEILKARRGRKRELRETIRDRRKLVDGLLALKGGPLPNGSNSEPLPETASQPKLKHYFNDE
jgi:putative transposase